MHTRDSGSVRYFSNYLNILKIFSLNYRGATIMNFYFFFSFTNAVDKEWFQNTLRRTAEKILGPDFQYYSPIETYFVDFLREPPEPTGDEPEDFVLEAPKIYEEIPRYSFRFQIFIRSIQKQNYINVFTSLVATIPLSPKFNKIWSNLMNTFAAYVLIWSSFMML